MARRLLVTFTFMLLPVVAQAGLSLQFSLSPAHTLPALPVTFTLSVNNSDGVSRSLPSAAVLVVTPDGRDPFFALAWSSHAAQSIGGWLNGTTTVPAHDRFTFDMPVDATLGNPPWFYDARLNEPGTYRLRVILGDFDDAKVRAVTPAALSAILPANSLTSNEVALTVDTPAGDDRNVWRMIADETNGRVDAGVWLNGFGLMKRIWAAYPNSTYSRYVVVRVPLDTIDDEIKAIRGVLAAAPDNPIADWQELQIAELERHQYGDAHGHGRDHGTLANYAQIAVSSYRAVVKTAHSNMARAVAQKKLDDFLDELQDDGVRIE